MRIAFDPQRRLGCSQIAEVELNLECRDEIIPLLKALQHIYSQADVRDQILALIGNDINASSSSHFGRKGMDYWEVLVLAAVRLGCNYDYDKLQDMAEQHHALRQIMGLGEWDGKTFDARRIRENICKMRPETIEQINHAIVAVGHELVPEAAETVRADSFVAETNIHYPTESTLIRDGLRKVLSLCTMIATLLQVDGWRQHEHLEKKAKKLARDIDRIAASKGKKYESRLAKAYRRLLQFANKVTSRADELRETAAELAPLDFGIHGLSQELAVFLQRTRQVCDTARRRVLEGEDVPNEDKLFSIFETHTQLYKRGKAGEPIQFGRLVMIYEDGAGFITHYHVLPRESQDVHVVVEQTHILQSRLQGRVRSGSFDRGFHSPENQTELAKILAEPCLLAKGKQGQIQRDEGDVSFHAARQRHSGVESAIAAIQCGNGLERCRDRTEKGFERYIGIGILGRNLHVLGKLLIAQASPTCRAGTSHRGPSAA